VPPARYPSQRAKAEAVADTPFVVTGGIHSEQAKIEDLEGLLGQ
jgi:hypothetical protein